MNYLIDVLDYTLIQFCPADVFSKEISLRRFRRLQQEEKYFWLVKDPSLRSEWPGVGYELTNSDLAVFGREDKMILIVRSPDSHLFTAESGFRYFLITFPERKFEPKIIINGVEHDAISILNLKTE